MPARKHKGSIARWAPSAGNGSPARRALLVLVLALAQGCAVVLPGGEPASRVPPAGPEAAERPAEVERRWLQSWFDGTPVAIRREADAVGIDVPREFCFRGNGVAVRAPLAAVLDKVAESLRRHPLARLQVLAAPGGDRTRVQRRAEQVLAHLRSRGVAAARLGSTGATGADAVRLRVDFAPR